MWVEAPPAVIDRLEAWALIRDQGLGELWNPDRRVLHVHGWHDGPYELEAFPMLREALNEAISQWSKTASRKPGSTEPLVLELASELWTVAQAMPGVLEADPLPSERFRFLGGSVTETRWAQLGPRRTHQLVRAVWTDRTEAVHLTFVRGKSIEVVEAGLMGPPNWLPTRHRPERVDLIEPEEPKYGIAITLAEQMSVAPSAAWNEPIWLPLPSGNH